MFPLVTESYTERRRREGGEREERRRREGGEREERRRREGGEKEERSGKRRRREVVREERFRLELKHECTRAHLNT